MGSIGNIQEFLVSTEPTQVGLSARIDELHGENMTLKRELEEWRVQATAESELRQQFEQEVKNLTVANQILHQDLQKSTMVAESFRRDINKYIHIVNGVMPLMDELNTGLTGNGGSGEVEPFLCPVVESRN
ncbi:hypothetical protein ONS96_004008 [Cadophora gregata f. sp. sojae]|nr:hypothetical protein ONS96_004008 [Cadophora gregata f. sp. sojae]